MMRTRIVRDPKLWMAALTVPVMGAIACAVIHMMKKRRQ